ncbi:hypothetical protein [Planctopirus hydrillae]|uniref:Outer membrane protein beta-barrel domain-containing protein n=1 Tax=Planctopirus hydrillae TaxID=1841610 RepID=A0A1C3EU95_9PLAN|nr:hypothetical protein [Planctopirus hydrillae]ODA36838.1 hypothetical protein A6X21_01845 [Planctopirus hydrillae]
MNSKASHSTAGSENWHWLNLVASVSLLITMCGCTEGRLSSRWAMDHQDYARKYGKPYEERGARKLKRMAKQASDARFLEDDTGLTAEVMGAGDPLFMGGALGVNHYFTPAFSGRANIFGALSEPHTEGFLVGLDAGVRLNSPSRFSPFVGVGAMAGYTEREIEISDSLTISTGSSQQKCQETSSMMAIYPEVGATFWLNGHTAIQGYGRYLISTDSHSQDWMCGIGMTFLLSPRVNEIGNQGRSYQALPPAQSPAGNSSSPATEPFFVPADHVETDPTIAPDLPEPVSERPLSGNHTAPQLLPENESSR